MSEVVIKTERFGALKVHASEIIDFSQGLIGYPHCTKFCLVDPNDDTLMLWLQSLEHSNIVFPVLEPKMFKPDYCVRLSAEEQRQLQLKHLQDLSVFTLLTLPEDLTQMTANLKAPLIIHLKTQRGKQVILQENEYVVQHPMFKTLRMQLVTLASRRQQKLNVSPSVSEPISPVAVPRTLVEIAQLSPAGYLQFL